MLSALLKSRRVGLGPAMVLIAEGVNWMPNMVERRFNFSDFYWKRNDHGIQTRSNDGVEAYDTLYD